MGTMLTSRNRLRLLFAVALAPVGAVACEQILGLEPGELRTTTTSSTTTAGTGAAAGQGGHAGSGGQGAGGSGGQPVPELVASGQKKPVFITSDGVNVYWANEGSGDDRVMKAPVDGSPDAEVAVAYNQASPVGIAQLANVIYWSAQDDGAIRTALKDAVACDGANCSQFAGGLAHPAALAIAADTLVWSETDPPDAGAVRRSALTPPSATDLATQQGQVWQLATGGGYAYWFTPSDGKLRRAPLTGGLPAVVWEQAPGPMPMAGQAGVAVSVDGAWVYWTNPDERTVSRAKATDTLDPSTRVELAQGEDHPIAVAVDGTHVYWINAGSECATDAAPPYGSVKRLPFDADGGQIPEILASDLCDPKGIALDDNNAYWTVHGKGEVYRRRK